jgi:protein-S-isoprenylcysteine O-methyltransferase Ste14
LLFKNGGRTTIKFAAGISLAHLKPEQTRQQENHLTLIQIHTPAIMNLRQKIQIVVLLFLILFAFASYHEGSGSTLWLQWLSIVAIMIFMFLFDVAFTSESSFLFDPDAENWRRKTVRIIAVFPSLRR